MPTSQRSCQLRVCFLQPPSSASPAQPVHVMPTCVLLCRWFQCQQTSSCGRCTHLPCAQQKHSSACPSCCTRSTHCCLLSSLPNMMALLQALLFSTRTTPGGGWLADPPVSSSWCRYSCKWQQKASKQADCDAVNKPCRHIQHNVLTSHTAHNR